MIKVLNKHTGGYTLIELLIALAVLGLVAAPCFALFTAGISAITSAGNRTEALHLGRNKVEELKSLGPAGIYSFYLENNNNPYLELNPDGYQGYSRVSLVTPVTVYTEPGSGFETIIVLQVDVTVTWEQHQSEKEQSLSCYILAKSR